MLTLDMMVKLPSSLRVLLSSSTNSISGKLLNPVKVMGEEKAIPETVKVIEGPELARGAVIPVWRLVKVAREMVNSISTVPLRMNVCLGLTVRAAMNFENSSCLSGLMLRTDLPTDATNVSPFISPVTQGVLNVAISIPLSYYWEMLLHLGLVRGLDTILLRVSKYQNKKEDGPTTRMIYCCQEKENRRNDQKS